MRGKTQTCEEGTLPAAGHGIWRGSGIEEKKKKWWELEPTPSGGNTSWIDSDEQKAGKESFFSCCFTVFLYIPTDRT